MTHVSRLKDFAPALKHIADIIERGIREHPELSVGMQTEGIEVKCNVEEMFHCKRASGKYERLQEKEFPQVSSALCLISSFLDAIDYV